MPNDTATPAPAPAPAPAPTPAPRGATEDEVVDVSRFRPLDILDLPDSFYISVVGSRRAGKSFTVNWLLQQFQRTKRRFTHIFLISPTDAGFEGIPRRFRFKDIDKVHHIVRQQRHIKKHNQKMAEARDRVKSRVCVVIDDCAHQTGPESLRSSQILEEMALTGRHVGHPADPEPGNGISFFVLTQSLTRISRAVRLNQDCFIFNAIASCKERELVQEEGFFLSTTRQAKRHARNLFESLVRSKDYRFICLANYIQNKKTHEDYIRVVDAKPLRSFQLFGTQSDDETDTDDDDAAFSSAKPRTLPGGREFISGKKPRHHIH
jgi:hypothetical protein